jgi:hypothetical protein
MTTTLITMTRDDMDQTVSDDDMNHDGHDGMEPGHGMGPGGMMHVVTRRKFTQ